MSKLDVVVIDDEPLARGLVRDLLARDPEITVVGEAGDGLEAIALIERLRPDIAFLDIEMPERGGIEVVQAIDPARLPAVVFVTAYSHYATEAFEREAIDYVVKPFADDRFFAALTRAKQRVRERQILGLAERLAAVSQTLGDNATAPPEPAATYLTRIPVQRDDRTLLLETRDVVWIESQDYCARVHTSRRGYLVRASLASFEAKLDPRRFLRVHRQALVNLHHVAEVEHLIKGALGLKLSNGARCPVSRTRRAKVTELLLPKLGA